MADRPRRILVIEDDAAIQLLVCDVLQAEGYDVRAAPDGRVALAWLAEWRPELILLDLNMPRMDGRAFRAAQASSEDLAGIPIVVTSAAYNAANLPPTLGAAGVLPKPFEIDELVSMVERLLSDSTG